MLRSICGIAHSVISRVSNDEVRRRTAQKPITDILLKRQLDLYCKAAQGGEQCPLRDSVFYPGTLTPVNDMCIEKSGAPGYNGPNNYIRTLFEYVVRMELACFLIDQSFVLA